MADSIFVRVHSYYSLLDGLASPTELVERAAELGYTSLALADRGYLTGAIEFYEACLASGIKPIIGLVLPIRILDDGEPGADGELVLFAEDLTGWSNLCRLSSALLSDPSNIRANSIPFSFLAVHGQGLACLVGADLDLFSGPDLQTIHAKSQQILHRLLEIFPERLFFEVLVPSPDNALHRRLVKNAAQLAIPVIHSYVAYYLEPHQAELRQVARAIRLNAPLASLPANFSHPTAANLLTLPELNSNATTQISETHHIQEFFQRCVLELPLYTPRFPELQYPPGETSATRLRELAYLGARQIFGEITPAIEQRLQDELSIIASSGYSALFLIMADILDFARQADIPTASRGSASSSLVAHCLKITTPDPVRLNLYFERFLNPARRTPPDIDTDVCSVRRDQLIRYVYEKYSPARVAMVATINRFRARSALREVAKAFGSPQAHIRKLVDELPWRGWGPADRAATSPDPYSALRSRYTNEKDQRIFAAAAGLINHPHHLSIHPGGVIISPVSLTDILPTALSSKGIIISQFDLEGIEKLGLVKIDLLGIRGLTVLGDVADNLRAETRGHTNPRTRLEILDAIPEDDHDTSQLVCDGDTIGCFQIESPGMRATLRAIQAKSIDDILVALALYRPGPMTGGLRDAYVRRHLGKEQIVHLHPTLAPLLQDTYGVILYQEQVLRIAHELAGLSLADADLLRRAMSHFDPGEQMISLKERFQRGAQIKSGVPSDVSERIWDLMAAFAGYGFPKAHAASYARVAWRSAWCKAHFPAEFMAAVLANWGGYYSQRVYIQEARRLGLRLSAPQVNHSQAEFSVKRLTGEAIIFMGLDQIRDLSRQTIRRSIALRPFQGLQDFVRRARPRPQELDHLIRCGALAEFGTIPELLYKSATLGHISDVRQLPLFNIQEDLSPSVTSDWTINQRAEAQEALLGISIDIHPLELVEASIAAAEVISSVEAAGRQGERVRIAGIRQTGRRSRTLNGDPIYLLTLEDLQGSMIVMLGLAQYRRYHALLSSPQPLIVEGIIHQDEETADLFLRAEKVWAVK